MKSFEVLKGLCLNLIALLFLFFSHQAFAQFSMCANSDAVCVGKILLNEIRSSSGNDRPVLATGAATFRDWGTYVKFSHIRSGQVVEAQLTNSNVEQNAAEIFTRRISLIRQAEQIVAICQNFGGNTFLIETSSHSVSIKRLADFMFESSEKCLNWMNGINSY